jgi:predicted DNA-binding transcriptional regulator YafY
MLSTSTRLLRLASLLQSRRHWPGAALVESLGVDARTVRRDVDRLRELGYPVEASSGVGGGYALGRGAELPPLMLDDEEAVALAIALRAATASIGGIEATVLRLLAKLDQLLPMRLRRRASALHAVTLSLRTGQPLVDAPLLTDLAGACRDSLALSFAYRDHGGASSQREVQPLRLANYGRRWYLVAWDLSRDDWRTFRADRIDGRPRLGPPFVPRMPPADVAARLERGIAYAPFSYRLTLRLAGDIDSLSANIPVWCGILEADGDEHCLLRVGADSAEALVAQVLMIGREAQLVEGQELVPQLSAVLGRMSAMIAPTTLAPAHSPSQ